MNYVNTLAQYRMSDDWAGHLARGSRGGIDYAVGMNTPILAPIAGRVENRSDNGNGFGNYIRFHHGNGFIDEYLHLNSFVAEGNYSQGQVIGYSGNTGNSTGPHVHWHLITPDGVRVNPLDYVAGGGGSAPAGVDYKEVQSLLAGRGYYFGAIDGIFGPQSWTAVQTLCAMSGFMDANYIDGVPGKRTYWGMQLYAQKNDNYRYTVDGIVGPKTWAGFTQSLREDAPKPVAPKPEAVKPVVPPVTPTPAPEKPVKPVKPTKPTRPSRPVKPITPVKEPIVPTIKPLPEDANTAANDALGILIPKAKSRKIAYAIYGLAALVVSNLSVAVMASGTQAPVWLIVVSAIVGNLAVPFTTLAIANANGKK